jgi:penicillin amidase
VSPFLRWSRRIAGALLLLLLVGTLVLWGYTRRASPRLHGDLVLAGASAPVAIERDAHGIPTIRAQTMADLMFGLGVAHAQDRLWQLETHRRIGSGRLAEAFGEGALETDRFLRALRVRRAAAAQWERTQGEARELLLAYARGINAHVKHHLQARPPEMLILGVEPEDWEPVDSLAWAIMMAWDLGGNWQTELLRLRLALRLPVERIDQLVPPYPGDTPVVATDYAALYRGLKLDGHAAAMPDLLERVAAAAPPSGVEGVGSNNWVVAGTHTTTGRPLLANDPHLKLTVPALWYFARLEAPGFKAAGATMPGLPLLVLGQSEHVAWGFTNTGPDVQDLYLERLDPADPARVQTPDGWAALDAVEETIKVKGRPDVKLTVRASRHGPLISDAGALDDVTGARGRPGFAIAMRWTALDPDADPVGTALQMSRAKTVAEFVKAAETWVAPMQNVVVADRAGRIGFVAPGRVPVRRPDHDLKGLVPALGWEPRYDWVGWVPKDRTPREFDPARGWLATANQRIHAPNYPYFLTTDWALPYRQQRIEQLLRARQKHSLEDLRLMQGDRKSLAAAPLLPWLAKASSTHELAAAAKAELEGFDGTMAPDRAAPLIFWAWSRQLTQAALADEMGPMFDASLGSRSFRDALEGVLERRDAWWCDDKGTPQAETCEQINDLAFTRALDELQARWGADVGKWQWGQAHRMRAEHRPFSRVRALAPLFEQRVPVGGDTYTVNVSRVNLRAGKDPEFLYMNEHGPSLRAVYDVGDPARSRVMHSSGQSGLPWSAHFRDFLVPWSKVEYVPLWPEGPPKHTLILRPK